jgi:hypothetical protein
MTPPPSATTTASSSSGDRLADSPAPSEASSSSRTNQAEADCPYAERAAPTEPCFLYKLVIREEWPAAKKEQAKRDEAPDPAEIDRQIEEKEKELWDVRLKLDDELLKDAGHSPLSVARLRDQRNRLQDELLELAAQRSKTVNFKVQPPIKGVREFTVLRTLPPDYKTRLEQADADLAQLRKDLRTLMSEWHKLHEQHEETKKQLMAFSKKLDAALARKDACGIALANARRARDERQKAYADYREEHNLTREDRAGSVAQWIFRRDHKSRTDKANAQFAKAQNDFAKAKREYDDLAASGHEELKAEEKQKREALYAKLKEVRAKIKEIEEKEKESLDLRNTMPMSGPPIQMTGGAAGDWWTPWKLNEYTVEKKGGETTRSTDDEDTPEVTVRVDTDKKPDAPTKDYQKYCAEPVRNAAGKHPYLRVTEPYNDFLTEDVTEGESGAALKFKAWQFRQYEPGTEKVERARFIGLRLPLSIVKTFFRILARITAGWPTLRTYDVWALACGYHLPHGEGGELSTYPRHAGVLRKRIELYPADSWEITLKANAFAGKSYEYEHKVQDASRPAAETGNLQYESSGSKKEVTKSETFSSKTMWGTESTSTTTSHIRGYDGSGSLEKDIRTKESTERSGSTVEKTVDAQGTFRGEAYSGSFHQTAHQDITGNTTGTERSLGESGRIAARRDDTGADRSLDDYRAQELSDAPRDYQSAPGTKLSRAPSMPGSFFPMIPVDISLKRNGAEDEVTKNIRNCIGIIVFLIRKTADCIGRVGNIVPSMGWKFGFQADFLSGSLSYFRQFREHVDYRVYTYYKGTIAIQIVTVKVFLFGGFWVDFVIGEIKLGAEIYVKGSVGIKGHIETTHPDADSSVHIGFGPTGSIGCGGEIMLVVGSADFAKAGGGVATSITPSGMWWLKHTDGPHFDYDIHFDGVKINVIGHFALVGTWEKIWHVVKERSLKQGRFPEAFDSKTLEEQSAEMDRHAQEDAREAHRNEQRRRRR